VTSVNYRNVMCTEDVLMSHSFGESLSQAGFATGMNRKAPAFLGGTNNTELFQRTSLSGK
jgi:hypothetical protein